MKKMLAVMALVAAWAMPSRAEVCNIHVFTDNGPDYTTMQSFVQTATGSWATPQEKATAIWRWSCKNRRQTSTTIENGKGLWDPVMFFNSYANTFCGYIAGLNTSMFDALGYSTCYVELGDHTVCEVSWDAGATWHLYDSSMCIHALKHDGTVASCQDIMNSDTCALSTALGAAGPEAGHYYLYHFTPECGTNPVNPAMSQLTDPWGYRCACDNPYPNQRTLRNGASSYTDGFSRQTWYTHIRNGFSYSLNLRPHEVYTRYSTHLGETNDFFRPMTDTNDPDTYDNLGNMRGNGRWEFAPDLSAASYRDCIYTESNVVHKSEDGGSGPAIHPQTAGTPGEVIFKVDGANVITSADIHIEGVKNTASDALIVSVSKDAGINWTQVFSAATNGAVNTNIDIPAATAGGAYQLLTKVQMTAAANKVNSGIDKITLTTITQVNRRTLPKLVMGANKVQFSIGEQLENLMLWPAIHNNKYSETSVESANIYTDANADHFYDATAMPVLGNTPAYMTWKLNAPRDLVKIVYGGSYCCRFNNAADWVKLNHSFNGTSYTQDWFWNEGNDPMDEQHYAEVTSIPGGTKSVWLKYETSCNQNQAWNSTGIQDVLMYAYYAPRNARFFPIEVTMNWTEHRAGGPVTREYTALITSSEKEWTINVEGVKDPTMNWVRMNMKGYGPNGAGQTYGYSDGQDVGTGAGYDKKMYVYNWLDNVARTKTYTVSRPADASNPDTGGTELTDGNIIPPTDYTTSPGTQGLTALWASGAALDVTINLGSTQTIAAFRVTTHQPNSTYVHPDHIDVALSSDGMTYTASGTINHNDLWKPPGNYLPWEHDDSPGYASLPAGGRLTYPYWLVLPATTAAQYVKCTFTPQSGKGMSISEVQVLSAVSVQDWPDKEIQMPVVTDLAVTQLTAAPNSGTVPVDVTFSLTVTGGAGPYSFAWDFGDGATSTVEDPVHQYTAGGNYTASVVVTDANGKVVYGDCAVTFTEGSDMTPPVVSVDTFQLSGTADDLVNPPVEVDVGGHIAPVAGNKTWNSIDFDITESPITISATDASGNTRQVIVDVSIP